jgi:hypothetical protein
MQSTGSAASLAHGACRPGRGTACGDEPPGCRPACGQSTGGLDGTGSVDVMAGRLHKLLVGRLPTSSQLPLPSNNPSSAPACTDLSPPSARHPHDRRHRVRTTRSLESTLRRRTAPGAQMMTAPNELPARRQAPFSRRTDSPRRQLRRGRVSCDRNRRPSSCSAGCAQAGLRHPSTTVQPHPSKWPRSF